MRICFENDSRRRGAAALLAMLLLTACAVGSGPVVRVTTVAGDPSAGLDADEQARLAELRTAPRRDGTGSMLEGVIARTPNYTVGEYLERYPAADTPRVRDYRIGGTDVLNVMVYEEPDLSRENLRVSAEGWISLPLVGRMPAAGLTPSELSRDIARRLAEQEYLLDAHVAVELVEYNSRHFMVLGAVKTPGTYPLKANERVLDAISRAGGVDLEKSGQQAMLIRTLAEGARASAKVVVRFDVSDLLDGGDQSANLLLAEDDLLYVSSADHYYIIGQVARPGKFTYPAKAVTLVEAVSAAGGFTPIAARNRTRIVREEDGRQSVIYVRVDAITESGLKGQDITVRPGDVIVVPESLF